MEKKDRQTDEEKNRRGHKRRKAGRTQRDKKASHARYYRKRQQDRAKNKEKGEQKKRSRSKKAGKRAAFDIGSGIVLIAAVCIFVFSLYQLVTMMVPYYSGGKEYDEIKDLAVSADENGEGFSIDFDALLEENPDTIGWIRFDEPSIISYPIVKSADNNEYLTKTFSANDNKLGAIFMDMRNSSDFSDRNTFIYGHHLNVGGEMFSQLLEYESEDFCKAHPDFYIYKPDGKVYTYTVFSAGVVKDMAENYNMTFETDEDFEAYIQICRDSSNYQVDVEVNAQSKIVSLSTCTNVRDDERFLVHGVLTAEE